MRATPKPERADVHQRLAELSLRFRIGVLEYLREKDPQDLGTVAELAALYTRAGRFQDGLRLDLELSRKEPANNIVHYNLACSYALLNQVEESLSALQVAVLLGYSDAEHMKSDPDLENVRSHPQFKILVERLARCTARD